MRTWMFCSLWKSEGKTDSVRICCLQYYTFKVMAGWKHFPVTVNATHQIKFIGKMHCTNNTKAIILEGICRQCTRSVVNLTLINSPGQRLGNPTHKKIPLHSLLPDLKLPFRRVKEKIPNICTSQTRYFGILHPWRTMRVLMAVWTPLVRGAHRIQEIQS